MQGISSKYNIYSREELSERMNQGDSTYYQKIKSMVGLVFHFKDRYTCSSYVRSSFQKLIYVCNQYMVFREEETGSHNLVEFSSTPSCYEDQYHYLKERQNTVYDCDVEARVLIAEFPSEYFITIATCNSEMSRVILPLGKALSECIKNSKRSIHANNAFLLSEYKVVKALTHESLYFLSNDSETKYRLCKISNSYMLLDLHQCVEPLTSLNPAVVYVDVNGISKEDDLLFDFNPIMDALKSGNQILLCKKS